ncbi:MAG: hypothetical protein HWD59_04415 [Coxiellaceae bacterium]|nr:MAG: hypothetical protein HWD59_04415 [Coxiellaceae bacterium]
MQLTRSLYYKGWDKASVLNLYAFIDYIMVLPALLELEYIHQIEHFEQESNVETLLQWTDAVIEANSLEELFTHS